MGQASEFRNLDPRDRRRSLRRGLVRPVATVALCGVGYFVLPWTSVDGISTVMLLVGDCSSCWRLPCGRSGRF